MSNKYNINRVRSSFEAFQKDQDNYLEQVKAGKVSYIDPKKKLTPAQQKASDKAFAADMEKRLSASIPSMKEFERRGFRFGTPEESWQALHQIAEAIEIGAPIPPIPAVWLLTALNSMTADDPKELVRALGFIENGRSRVVNKFDLVERMIELVEGQDMKKIEAARVCAGEFNCHYETALYWYRKKAEVFAIKQR